MSVFDPSYIDNLLTYGYDPRQSRFVLSDHTTGDAEPGKDPVAHCINALLHLDAGRSEEPIHLWVNTSGGLVSDMFALYDVIRTRRRQVVTTGTGLVASAGVLLLAAGDRRRATRNCWLMSHANTFGGEFHDTWTAQQNMDAAVRWEARWARLMHRCTGFRTERWWRELHKGRRRELWLDAEEMLEYGIVDEVLDEVGA